MAVEASIDTNKVLKKINKNIKEIKNGISSSDLSVEDVKDIQNDLEKVKQLALKLKGRFK